MTFKIHFKSEKSMDTQLEIEKYRTKSFDAIVNSTIFNAKTNSSENGVKSLENTGYLIIVHDNFYNNIQTFATQKENHGYEVTVVRKSEISNQTNNGIRSYIQDAYNNWTPAIEYVLLVGDVNYIPEFTGEYCNSASDYQYSLMDDDDWLPDILVARFSVTNTYQLDNISNKIIDYENQSWSSPEWTKKSVFMAGEDNYTITENTHNYVISNYMQPSGYTSDKLYTHTYNATTNDVINAFNDGRVFGVYSGHGSETAWTDGPPLNQSQVTNLNNQDKYALVFSFACLTGDFNYPVCFGETWLREYNKAAVGFWGASNYSYWDEDDILERKLFGAFFNEYKTTFGCATVEAKLKFIDHYTINGERTKYYLETYNLLGDPSLKYANFHYNLANVNKSNSKLATAYNNGRRMVVDNYGRYHLVFEVDGNIYYRYSDDGTVNWSTPVLLSEGNDQDFHPAIAQRNGYIYVVWQKHIPQYPAGWINILLFGYSPDRGENWVYAATGQFPSGFSLWYHGSSTPKDLWPCIVIDKTSAPFDMIVAFSHGSSDYIRTKHTTNPEPSDEDWDNVKTVPGSQNGQYPVVVYTNGMPYTKLFWSNGSSIYYSTAYFKYGIGWSSKPVHLSYGVEINRDARNNNLPTAAVSQNGTIHTAWEGEDWIWSNPGYIYHVIFYSKNLNPNVYHEFANYWAYVKPSLTGHSGSTASILWHDSTSQRNIRKAYYDGSNWDAGVLGEGWGEIIGHDGCDPSTTITNPPGGAAKGVWLKGKNPPYELEFGPDQGLQKYTPR